MLPVPLIVLLAMLWILWKSQALVPAVTLEELDFAHPEGTRVKAGITYLWANYMTEEETEHGKAT